MIINLLIAFVLDLIIGDPKWIYHPVRLIGLQIHGLEKITRASIANERLAGAITALLNVTITTLVVWGSIEYAASFNIYAGRTVTIVWLYFGLAIKSLGDHVLPVCDALKNEDIEKARQQIALVVARDTARLDAHEVSRAAVETVAENTIDGIITPLFFAMLGGAPALWAFKAISTGDSMLGYRNEKYKRFGTWAARLDDVANLIPARLSYILYPVACLASGVYPAGRTLKVMWRDSHHHDSPNAGIPEAATAGALGIKLGGRTIYDGVAKEKEPFGKEFPEPEAGDIREALILSRVVTLLMLGASLVVTFFLYKEKALW